MAGGINQFLYVYADPNNLYDPTGEIAPAIALIGAAARAYATCLARCTLRDVVLDGIGLTGDCVDVGNSAKNCALSCLNPLNWGGGKASGLNPIKKKYSPTIGSRKGKDFTPAGKRQVKQDNSDRNNGQMKCEKCGKDVNPANKHEKDVTPPNNEAHVDHIVQKSKDGSGTPENGQILCRTCNLEKSNKL